jgi:hypothetical protein
MRDFVRGLTLVALVALPMHLQAQTPPDQPAAPMQKTAQIKLPPSRIPPKVPLSQRERAVQMLNRFTFGPRPGDVEKVLALGPDKWFEQQLAPETISDGALDRRMGDYPTIKMTAEQILGIFPDRGVIQQVADGKRPYPVDDPLLQSVYEVQVYKLLQEQERTRQQTELAKNPDAVKPTDAEVAAAADAAKKLDQATAARITGELFALAKKDRMTALNAMPVPDRIAFANYAPNDQKNMLMGDFSPRERETIYAMQGGVGGSFRR